MRIQNFVHISYLYVSEGEYNYIQLSDYKKETRKSKFYSTRF